MNLRYGKADENVLKRSVADVILHERQKIAAYDELKKDAGSGPAPGGSGRTGSLFSEDPDTGGVESGNPDTLRSCTDQIVYSLPHFLCCFVCKG